MNSKWIRFFYRAEALVYATQGVFSDFQQVESMKMIKGRFINYTDEQSAAKVVVVGNKIAKDIFKLRITVIVLRVLLEIEEETIKPYNNCLQENLRLNDL